MYTTNSSPCRLCERREQIEKGCWKACERLRKWQWQDDPSLGTKLRLIAESRPKGVERLKDGRCDRCAGKVVHEEGVVFCVECLRIFLRMPKVSKEKVAGELVKRDWDVHDISDLLGVSLSHVYRAKRVATGVTKRGTAREVIEEMVRRARSGWTSFQLEKEYGLHRRTIRRLLKERGCGFTEIKARLKEKGLQLIGKGWEVGKIAKELNIKEERIRNWKRRG